MRRLLFPIISLLLMFHQSAGFAASEQSGYPSLEPLLARVEQSVAAQQAAAEQFQKARQSLSALAGSETDDVQPLYATTFHDYNDSIEAAVAMGSAIAAVDEAANAIFQEWEEEIAIFTDARLKADNEARLTQVWQSYQSLMNTLRQSESESDSVLAALKSNVTYFKYNLNAAGVASRRDALSADDKKIASLINAINTSIAGSDAFIRGVQ
jgi:hypothetical protein